MTDINKENLSEEAKLSKEKELKLKKQNSYTYWVNNDPNYFKDVKIDIQPKPLDLLEASKIKEAEENPKNKHSAWNSAGTWEERKLDIQLIKDMIEKYIIDKVKTDDAKYIIYKLKTCEGDAKCIMSRGKKRLGYQLDISFKLKGANDSTSEGQLKFINVMDDGDYEYEVTSEGDANTAFKESIKKSIKSISQALFEAINKLKEC